MIRAALQEVVRESGHPPAPGGSSTEPASAPPVLLTSQEVLRGQKAVTITHNGALYRLQTTRQGKLILTK
jgi:hemin uptake protein HemP